MALSLVDLDETTRRYMMEEFEQDVQQGKLYVSARLSGIGRENYPALLKQALRSGNDSSLAESLRQPGVLNQTEERKKPKGGISIVKVPETAAETMAEGEFNRFYMRGLCRRVIDSGKNQLTIYRAKSVMTPRPESEAKIGQSVDAKQLLDDLRERIGIEPALGLPMGPNSGLSVRLQ
jgi:hypothetical protein